MPTETFYRLPQEKRDRLVAAIYDELSRVPVTELSINRIVHGAGISRGSFYQYFRDRDDLILYLLEHVNRCVAEFVSSAAPECNGDPFELIRRILKRVQLLGSDPNNRAFCTNLLAHLRANGNLIHVHSDTICFERIADWFDAYFDRSILNIESPEDFHLILELLLTLLRSTIAELFTPNTDADAILHAFDRKLTILQQGMLQRKEPAHAL